MVGGGVDCGSDDDMVRVKNTVSLLLLLGGFACARCAWVGWWRRMDNLYDWKEEDTWLILPVVICLSQRLSHACVSINSFVL